MKKIGPALLLVLFALVFSGCSMTHLANAAVDHRPDGAEIDQMDAVTSGGNRQAVLSLHKRYAFADACKFGLTLTNKLPYVVTNISFRFAAYTKGDVFYRQVTRSFIEIDPAKSQYREIDFPGITCDGINYVEITDPGRCAMGDLVRLASQPGDCISHVYIAETPYVRLVRK